MEFVVFISDGTPTLSSISIIEVTNVLETRGEYPFTNFIFSGSSLQSTGSVLDFLLEVIDFFVADSTFFVEVLLVFFNKVDPLIDVNSLVIRIIEEGDDFENLLFVNTASSSVLFGEMNIRAFEFMREDIIPETEASLFNESNIEIVGKSGEILTSNSVVNISNIVELLFQFFELLMVFTLV